MNGEEGRFWMLFLANPRRLRAASTRGVIFPDRSPPERFLGSWLPRKGRGQRGWEPWSHFTRRAHSAHRPAREPPHSSSSAGIPPCLSTSWCVPRFSSRPPVRRATKTARLPRTGIYFAFGSPEAPRGPGVSALPVPRRWPRPAATSPRDEISASELTDIPDSSRTWRVAERKVHPRQVQHLARLLRRLLRLGQGTHQRGARLVRWRIKVDEAPNLSPNRTIAPVPENAWTDDDVAPSRAFAFVSAGRSPRRG